MLPELFIRSPKPGLPPCMGLFSEIRAALKGGPFWRPYKKAPFLDVIFVTLDHAGDVRFCEVFSRARVLEWLHYLPIWGINLARSEYRPTDTPD